MLLVGDDVATVFFVWAGGRGFFGILQAVIAACVQCESPIQGLRDRKRIIGSIPTSGVFGVRVTGSELRVKGKW